MTIVFPRVTLRLSSIWDNIFNLHQVQMHTDLSLWILEEKYYHCAFFYLYLITKSHYFILTPRNGNFLIKLLVLSHLYNNYIWAGESWTFTSVDSNVRCEREKSHPTVDLSPADNGHYCYNIYASIGVYVPWCHPVKRSESANLRWFTQILRWGSAILDEVSHKILCTRHQLNMHEITSPVDRHI